MSESKAKSPLDKVLGRKDYKAMYDVANERIEELEHQNKLELARVRRQHDTDVSAHRDSINRLEDELTVFKELKFSYRELKRKEQLAKDENDKLDARETALDLREKQLTEQYDAKSKHLDELHNHRTTTLDKWEQELEKRDDTVMQKEDDKHDANYQRGYADGRIDGLENAGTMHKAALEAKDQLLNLHTLGTFSQQPQVILQSGDVETKQSDASKQLSEAFGKHLAKTVDKMLGSDEKKDKK